jgi:rubrerythrin
MDILEYAIKMELDGEKFYLDLALENRDNSLHTVFLSLAHDEANHAQIIRKKKEGVKAAFTEAEANVKNVFSDPAGFKFGKSNPGQVDAYREALKKEQESIDLYKKLMSESEEGDRELFSFLIEQEKEHYRLLEEIIRMVNRPNEWVESAEFGIREEY